ncbi:fungal-specific transcription factor domain-containing protein [Aspergillus germanicus]
MDPPRPLKRVSRACDYCRKKRLYGATCSTSDPRAGENQHPGPSAGDKRTQETAGIGQIDHRESNPPQHQQTSHPEAELDPELSILHSRTEVTPDFDQYAQELGLVFAPYCPPQSPPSLALNHGFDTTVADDGFSTLASYPVQLPSPRLSDGAPSHSVFQGLDLGRTVNVNAPVASTSHPHTLDMAPPPPRPAHELFLRKGSVDTKFIGMGSVGSTISECLRYGSMESAILAHLVNGIRHVDELSLPTATPLTPLPDRDVAERGIRTYHERLHLLYPIVDVEFLDGWRQIYDEGSNGGTLSPIAYCRLCLVVLVGNIISPQRGAGDHWEASQRLHQQTWSLLGQVMASAFMESMQVMLLHTLFLLYCGKTGIAWMTCGVAVHIAQSLGLHQHPAPQLELTAQQIDMRSKLWSVAYALDAFLSLSEGRPSSITGSPPSLASSFFTSLSHSSSYRPPLAPTKPPAARIHDWLVSLAAIASSVVSLLKSGDSPLGTLTQIGEIDTQLLVWKDSIPMELRPDQQILADDPVYSAMAMLHLKYHNLMRTIHWVSLTLSTTDDSSSLSTSSIPSTSATPRPNPRILSSPSICLASSRSIIDVLNASSSRRTLGCPGGPGGSAGGFIVPYCMAAISTFYRQILKEPRRHRARTDLELMRNGTVHVVGLLDSVRPRSHFRALFREMLRVAEEVWLNKK